ncbi:MAG: Fibronectin type III domain protein [Methanomassiliicoccales archaeon PtaU1.Bin124]|nr:MAG: Fibronectin type III domain protein [Methanomassiliicoccales archaeon PtaU1.Bin124]
MRGFARTAAIMLAAAMLLSALPVASISASTGTATAQSISSELTSVKNGVTTSYHQFTAAEVSNLKSLLGVRVEGTDYNVVVEGHGTGLAPLSVKEYETLADTAYVVSSVSMDATYPSSLDLSQSSCFPAVGDQLSLGACAAWAMTYYCYGYLEAVDQGWTQAKSGATSQLLSPSFTYNRISDYNSGSSLTGNAQVIRDWGVPTLSVMPYNIYDYTTWGDDAAMRNAVLHRAEKVMYMTSATTDDIKAIVQSGCPVTFALDATTYVSVFSGDGASKIISAVDYSSTSLNHAQTIVGWDDTITEDGDVGAFRVVNSWGVGFCESGYYWITYAAMAEMLALSPPTYIQDKIDYVPQITAVVQFSQAPARDTTFTAYLYNNVTGAKVKTRSFTYRTTYYGGPAPKYSEFLFMDLTDFAASYSSTNCKFTIAFTNGATAGEVSSFRIEWYDNGYVVGQPTQKSGSAIGLPTATPGTVSLAFTKYASMSIASALDTSSLSFSTSGDACWTPVVNNYCSGGDAMQSGDISSSHTSRLTSVVTGPMDLSFYWMVSSQSGADFLQCSVDSVVQASISGSTSWAKVSLAIASGTHTISWAYIKSATTTTGLDCGYVDLVDTTGGTSDITAPTTVPSVSGAAGTNSWYTGTVTVSLTASDSGTGVQATKYQLDSGAWSTYASALSITADGTHTLLYYSIDNSGNVEATKTLTIKKDSVSPATTVSVSSYIVTLTRADAMSGIYSTQYRIDGGAWTSYSSPFTAGAAGGSYQVEYYSIDKAGNTEPVNQVTVGATDSTAPTTALVVDGTQGTDYWYTTMVNVYLTASDDSSGVASTYYKIDSGAWTTYASPFLISTDGQHNVQYYSVDMNGNTEATTSTMISVDLSEPTTSASAIGYAVTLTAGDAGSGVSKTYYRISSGSWAQYSAPFSAGVSGYQYQVDYYSVDLAGLIEDIRTIMVGTADTVPPVTSINVQGTTGSNGWYTSSVSITLTSSDASSTIKAIYYRWQGTSSWTTYLSPFTTYTEGIRTLEYYAADSIGNTESVKTLFIKIDKTKPVSSHTASSMMVTLSATDATSGVGNIQYNLDNAGWTAYSSPIDAGSAYQVHTLLYRAIDNAGNTEASHSISLGTADVTAPITGLAVQGSAGSNGWYLGTCIVSLVGTDGESGVYQTWYALDSGSWVLYSTTISLTESGAHVVSFYSVDKAGNVEATVTRTVQIDNTVPTSEASILESTVSITAADATSGIAKIEYRMDGGELTVYSGTIIISDPTVSHSLVYRSTDMAGNVEAEHTLIIPIRTNVLFEVPSPPLSLDADVSGNSIVVSWLSPADNGNASILGYNVYRATGSTYQLISTVTGLQYVDSAISLGATYSYYVTATNVIGESAASNQASILFVSLPSPPSGVSASMLDGSVLVSWSVPASDGGMPIQNYILTRSSILGEQSFQLSADTYQYKDTAVTIGQTYTYTIFSINAMGKSATGASAMIKVPYDMSQPSYLTATLSDGKAVLIWNSPNGSTPTSYLVRRSVGTFDAAAQDLARVTEKAYVDPDLVAGTTYCYQVCAIYDGEMGPFARAMLTVPDNGPSLPSAPSGLTATAISNGVWLTWTAVDGADEYRIFRMSANDSSVTLVGTSAATDYIDGSPLPNTKYSYWVAAANLAGEGPRSDPAHVATPVTLEIPPTAPQSLQFQVDGDTLVLSWTAPANAGTAEILGYRVYRSLENSSLALIAIIKATQFNDGSIASGKEYRYWVCAYSDVGDGEMAGPVVVVRPAEVVDDPTVPDSFTLSSYKGMVSLTWQAPDGNVIGYNIYCGNSTSDMTLLATVPASMFNYVDGSSSGKYYAIAALYESGEGVRSSPVYVHGLAAATITAATSTTDFLVQPWFYAMLGLMGAMLVGAGLITRRKK